MREFEEKNKYKMISLRRGIFASFIIMACFLPFLGALAADGISERVNFQGKVTNLNGTNVVDGNYDFTFRFYDAASGGNLLWTENWNSGSAQLNVIDGIFHVELGTYTALSGVDFSQDNIYLSIEFNSDGEMDPRVHFTAAPYAFNAQKVNGLNVTNTDGTLTIPDSSTISFANNFTTAGNFGLTLTTTADTNITLPEGNVTLVDLESSQTLENKTIGSSGLVFSGATNDITTPSGEHLSIMPGDGGNVGIGTTSPGSTLTLLRDDAGTVFAIRDTADSTNVFAINESGVVTNGIWQGGVIDATYLDSDVVLAGDNISRLSNDAGYITASSSDNLTNKTGNISMWTNDSGYITDGNAGWDNSYGFLNQAYQTAEDEGTALAQRSSINFTGAGVTCADSGGKTVCTISGAGAGAVSLAPSSANTDNSTNPSIWINDTAGGNLLQLQSGGTNRFVIDNTGNVTGGTYNTATISGGSLSSTAVNGITTANIVLTTGSYANPSWITSLAASKVGLGNVENVALSTWAGTNNITTLGTISSGTWQGNVIDSSYLDSDVVIAGDNISRLTNDAGYITASSSDNLTNKTGNISMWTNDSGYITDGNAGWDNSYGFITDPNDSVQGSELDGTFSSNGIMIRTGAATYSTITDNSVNWNTAYGWGNHSVAGYAVLNGQAGGQTLIGGTVADDALIFQGNSATIGNTGTSTAIQFNVGNSGATNALSILQDGTIDFHNNPTVGLRIENADSSVLAPSCDGTTLGRMYYDTSAGSAFVCIESNPGVYGWFDYTSTTVQSNKVVTVGTGGDYTSISAGAGYLNALGGGILLLTPETHNVTSAIDLENINLIGANTGDTRINITGSGRLLVKETQFKSMTIYVNAGIAATSGIDAKYSATTTSSIIFEWVDFITNGTKVLVNSTSATAPTVRTRFISTSTTSGTQKIFLPKASANLSATSTHFVESQGGSGSLDLEDWNVKIAGSSNVKTSGTIETIPDSTIFVYPGMNLQGAINSISSGGVITLLPGVHTISNTLLINRDDIQLEGYGDASILRASGFVGGATVGAIQIGSVDGSIPNDGVILKDFKLEVSGTGATDIHGIRMAGGEDNQILNVTVLKTTGASGNGGGARMGMLLMDGTAEKLTRPVIKGCRVLGTQSVGAYFTDGIHVTGGVGYGAGSGIFTNGQGIDGALVDGNYVDYVRETVAVFVGVNNSSLFNNRFSRMGAGGGGAFGVFFGNSSNVNMTANVVATSLSTGSYGIVIDTFDTGSLKQVTDSVFTANAIDGSANGGVGFAWGVNIGNASNTTFSRNVFTNNTINGASNVSTTALNINGNADDNNFSNNIFNGINNPWDMGINLASTTAERNFIGKNAFINTTTNVADSATGTQLSMAQHNATVNPTVNDDSADGYTVGAVWINTATSNAYIATNVTVGAATWEQIDATGGSGTADLDMVYTNDADKVMAINNASGLEFVSSAAGNIAFDLQSTGDFVLQDNNATFLTISDAGGFDYTLDATDNPAFIINNLGTSSFIINDQAGDATPFIVDQTGNVSAGGNLAFLGTTPTISTSALNSALTIDANGTGAISIGGTSTGNLIFGGGSASTGCTLDNVTGNFTCAGNITPVATSGQQGWLTRTGTSLAPSNAGDAITTSGNVSTTGTGTITSAGLITGTSGVSIGANQSYTGAGAVNLTSATASALNIDSGTTGALSIGTGSNAKTITIGNSTGATGIAMNTGSGDFSVNANQLYIDQPTGSVGIGTTTGTDKLNITQSVSTVSNNGLGITYAQSTNAANLAAAALRVLATSSGDAGDTLYGLNIDNITSTASTETGLRIGTGWDTDIQFTDTTPVLAIPNGSDFVISDGVRNLMNIRSVGGNFGSSAISGAFMDYNSSFYEGFNKFRPEYTGDQSGGGSSFAGVGDGTGWGVYSDGNTGCTGTTMLDEINGILRLSGAVVPEACMTMMDEAIRDPRSILQAANMPVAMFKIKPSAVSANNRVFVGMGNATDGQAASDPGTGAVGSTQGNGFIGFTNNGANWVGRVQNGAGNVTNVTCTGKSVQTGAGQFAIGLIEVRGTSEVRFYMDNDVSDGVDLTPCDSVATTNIPSVKLGAQVQYQMRTGGVAGNVQIDYFKYWQDDAVDSGLAYDDASEQKDIAKAMVEDMYGVGTLNFGKVGEVEMAEAENKFEEVDVLEKIAGLKFGQWETHNIDGTYSEHISPNADEFFKALGLGSDGSISALDLAGVALAGVQELDQKQTVGLEILADAQLEIENNATEVETLGQKISAMQNIVDALSDKPEENYPIASIIDLATDEVEINNIENISANIPFISQTYKSADDDLKLGDLVQFDAEEKDFQIEEADEVENIIGVAQNNSDNDEIGVVMSGQVKIKVSAENGKIEIGDYLTLLEKNGTAEKATKSGRVIGRALENYDDDKSGLINAIISIQDVKINEEEIFSADGDYASVRLNLNVMENMVLEKALIVSGPTEFKGQVFFASAVQFEDEATFKKDTTFDGTVTFNSDTAGFTEIKKGEKKTRISFDKAFGNIPVVQASIALLEDDSDEARDKIFEDDIRYIITNQTKEGFTIEIKEGAPTDIRFSWTALTIIEKE